MALSVTYLPDKHGDLGLMTSTNVKNPGSVVCAYKSSPREVERPLGFTNRQDR